VLFGILFIYLFAISCFQSLSLIADDFRNLEELDVQDFEQKLPGEKGKLPLTILILCALSFSLVHILGS
jgi:hypothetical protein